MGTNEKSEKKGDMRAFVLRSSGSGGCSRGSDAELERVLETVLEGDVAKEEKGLLVVDNTTWTPLPLLI